MAEKIAILLVQLGDEITGEIFSNLDLDSITEVSKYIAQNSGIDKALGGAVLEEFYAIFQSNQYISTGGFEYAKELLYRTLGPEAAKKFWTNLQNLCNLPKTSPTFLVCAHNNFQTLSFTNTPKQLHSF